MGTTYGGLTGKSKEDFGHGAAWFVPYTNVFDNPVGDSTRLERVEIDPSQNVVRRGDALFTVSSETPEEVGMSSVWPSDLDDLYLNSFCFGYRQDGSFDPSYLAYMLRADSFRNQIEMLAQGISRFNISKGKVMEIEVPVPNKREQARIGRLFVDLGSLITLHQRKRKYRGLYGYLSWEQRKLGDLISVYIAHAGPEEDVTVLTSSRDDIQKQEDHFGRLQQHDTSDWNLIPYGYCTYRNRSDDGLFTFNVNKVADRGIVSKFYPVFETPECDADFLVAYLNSSQEIRKKLFVLAVGTSQVVLSYGALKELSLLLPQNREQSAIANVLNHIDNLITLHQ